MVDAGSCGRDGRHRPDRRPRLWSCRRRHRRPDPPRARSARRAASAATAPRRLGPTVTPSTVPIARRSRPISSGHICPARCPEGAVDGEAFEVSRNVPPGRSDMRVLGASRSGSIGGWTQPHLRCGGSARGALPDCWRSGRRCCSGWPVRRWPFRSPILRQPGPSSRPLLLAQRGRCRWK